MMMDFSTYESASKWGEMISKSGFCPADCRGNIAEILMRIEYGVSLGLSPLHALREVKTAPNGAVFVSSEAKLALCLARPDICEFVKESFDEQTQTAICEVKRKGTPKIYKGTYSAAMAQKKGLWGKSGPWTMNPKKMLAHRARTPILALAFPDILKGIAAPSNVSVNNTDDWSNDLDWSDQANEPDMAFEPDAPCVLEAEDRQNTPALLLKKLKQTKPETHATLLSEIEEKHVSNEIVKKWLTKAQVEALSQLSQEQVSACLGWIEKNTAKVA